MGRSSSDGAVHLRVVGDDEYPVKWDERYPDRHARFMEKVCETNHGGVWECFYCGAPLRIDVSPSHTLAVTADHVIPRAVYECHKVWNVVLCCKSCNNSKKAYSYEEFTGEDQLPEQCHAHFIRTFDAVLAQRFRSARLDREQQRKVMARGHLERRRRDRSTT